MSETDLSREIRRVEKAMLEHARNLEFEQAAQARDQLRLLKVRLFGIESTEPNAPSAPALAPKVKRANRRG